ncbi:hypothetical protein VPHD292_0006 [Vibrio phage D292]
MPLSIEMNKIDTEYKSLSEVDPEITRFYSEDVRTRVVGQSEPDEEGNVTPITESYVIIVLNQPDEVTYEYAESRRGRRLGEDAVKASLVQAIDWEDFAVNHNGYLAWQEEYLTWETEKPTELVGEEEVLVPAPERPVIDMANRRAVYEQLNQSYDTVLFHHEEVAVEFNDELFTATSIPVLIDNDPKGIAEHYAEKAISTRYNSVYAPLETTHGLIDVGRGKDGILGIENIKDTAVAYDAGLNHVDSVAWIMADNSVVMLTIDDIKQIIVDFNLRKQVIFNAYGAWRETDRQAPFIYQ